MPVNAVRSVSAAVSMSATSGHEDLSAVVTCLYWATSACGSVWANTAEISALIGLECLEPNFWVTLRAKWTRQRCQPAPGRIAVVAALIPLCASEMTNATPNGSVSVETFRPRSRRLRRKSVQKSVDSSIADGHAEDLSTALGRYAGGHDNGLGDDPAAFVVDPAAAADVDVGRVEVDVGEPGVGQRSGEELLDGLVDVGTDPRDGGLRDSGVDAESFDQVIDCAGGYIRRCRPGR